MLQRIRRYALIHASGHWYQPRSYGDPQVDDTWDGWLVFFPVNGGEAITSGRETTQASFEALTTWAAGLTPVYLDGALARALRLSHRPDVLSRLDDAEYETLEDAERLGRAAEIERVGADVDHMAAARARADAEQLRRERLATERGLAAIAEGEAIRAAEIHEEAARRAHAVAVDPAPRSRHAQQDTARATRPKKRRSARK